MHRNLVLVKSAGPEDEQKDLMSSSDPVLRGLNVSRPGAEEQKAFPPNNGFWKTRSGTRATVVVCGVGVGVTPGSASIPWETSRCSVSGTMLLTYLTFRSLPGDSQQVIALILFFSGSKSLLASHRV
ncbi:hypothetical protein MG293_009218 [Ovis ammon polii]|uniref:Uncharacterized protein n=1 Tax=Ovis ammon polii TaxID=230172 RepID=A0AAD4YAI3_OVIAM|nr:hypothetical protein MG293_009218 [Ovis ammon polii]